MPKKEEASVGENWMEERVEEEVVGIINAGGECGKIGKRKR